MLDEYKVTQEEIDENSVSSVDGNKLTGSASENKSIFDKLPLKTIEKHNELVDEMSTSLEDIYTKSETDAQIDEKLIEIGAGDMVQGIYDPYRNMTDIFAYTDAKVLGATDDIIDIKASIVSMTAMIENLVPKVGSIHMSTENTNPSTYFEGTTWVAWGSGRVPVGVDTTDSDFYSVEKTGGSKNRTLMAAINWSASADNVSMKRVTGQTQWTANRVTASTLPGLSSSSTSFSFGVEVIDYNTAETPSLVQPYITCYMWKRTA